ncbi:Monothiol glutaredoxin-S10 [Glycine soja]
MPKETFAHLLEVDLNISGLIGDGGGCCSVEDGHILHGEMEASRVVSLLDDEGGEGRVHSLLAALEGAHYLLAIFGLASVDLRTWKRFWVRYNNPQVDVPSTCTTKDVPSNVLGQRILRRSFFHGLFPSGWRLLSPLLLCLPLHLHGGKSPLKDLIEAQRSSLHRSPTSKLPSSGNQSTRASNIWKKVRKKETSDLDKRKKYEKSHKLAGKSVSRKKSVNGEGTSHKDPLSRILDELSSLKLWKEKQERKEKGKKRVEEISQDERKKIREEERRKIMKEMKREKHASYSSHNSCQSLSEELRDYYEGRHRSHLRPHSHRREKERKPQEANINLSYFHGKDNVEANLDWEIRVEQQLKKKSTSKSYDSHSYPKKDQGQGILGVTPSRPKDDKGKTIEKQAPKASMQEKTSSIKCFKCLGRGHITSQCPTTKTMIMRGQDIYSSQDEATTSPSSSESEEAKGEESSEEIYPQEDRQPLVVKEKCKEVSVSSKRLAKKETHFTIKTNIKETFPLRQPPHLLLCKKTLVSTATPLGLEVIPQVKELLDEGLVRKSLNPCALLVPKIGVEGRSPEYEEPQDLRSNPFQGGGDDAILPPEDSKRLGLELLKKALGFFFHGLFPSEWRLLSPLLLCLPLHLHGGKSPLKDLIEAQRSSLHRSPTSKLPSIQTSSSSFLSKAHLGGEAPSSMAYSLVDGASSHLFSFVFRCISMDLIEAQRSSLHRSPTSKLPSIQTSSSSFLSKAILGGEAPSSLAYSLVDGASPLLFSFAFRCISMMQVMKSATQVEATPPPPSSISLGLNKMRSYEMVHHLVSCNAVVVFSMSDCCMSTVAKRLLFSLGVGPTVVELDEQADGPGIRSVLYQLAGSHQPVPAVFIGGKFLGGVQTLMASHINGTLDVSSNVLRQRSQAIKPLILCEWGYKRILRRLVLRTLLYKGMGRIKRILRLCRFEFFDKGEGRHKRIQVVSPSFFWKREKRDTKRIQAVKVMQSYPARALDRKQQVDWARDAREGPRVLMSLRGKGRIKRILRLCRFEFFDKGEGGHKRIQAVSPLFFWKREKKDTKRIQAGMGRIKRILRLCRFEFFDKREGRHKRIQAVSPSFFWKKEKRDIKRIQAVIPWRILFGKGRRE